MVWWTFSIFLCLGESFEEFLDFNKNFDKKIEATVKNTLKGIKSVIEIDTCIFKEVQKIKFQLYYYY